MTLRGIVKIEIKPVTFFNEDFIYKVIIPILKINSKKNIRIILLSINLLENMNTSLTL